MGLRTRVLTDPTLLERCLATGEPDVMTLDMEMPLRSGLEVLDVLAARASRYARHHQLDTARV
jgi:CheY-like chemotaxis protein